ncbi:MAG: hypothetical protein MK076_00930 [Flavobacteriales bacterium]|nr:hypothetical protein [Flavobacteriales bacterium]
MKIGIVVPDRPGRECFKSWWSNLINFQIAKGITTEIFHINEELEARGKRKTDLVQRCHIGVDKAIKSNCQLIFFWENDDYYSAYYLATLVRTWIEKDKPDAIGADQTTYIHVKDQKVFYQEHKGRSSLFHTAISAEYAKNINWDQALKSCPFLDLFLWEKAKTKALINQMAIGLKHGIGYVGGNAHNSKLRLYNPINKVDLYKLVPREMIIKYKTIINNEIARTI